MRLNIIKELRTSRKALEAMTELYDEKKRHLQRAVRRMSYLEGELNDAHERIVKLEGKLEQQEKVMLFVMRQNTDISLASRSKTVVPPTISVTEVRTDGKAENSNSRA